MNSKVRTLVLAGAGLVAGATMTAGPAQAVGSATAAASSTQVQSPPHGDDLIGYFRTQADCEWAGRVGRSQDRWDDPDCDRVGEGPNRGMWKLQAREQHDQGRPDRSGDAPGQPGGPGAGDRPNH